TPSRGSELRRCWWGRDWWLRGFRPGGHPALIPWWRSRPSEDCGRGELRSPLRGHRELEALRLELCREAGLFDGFHVGLVRLHLFLLHQIEQGIVQRDHPQLLAGLDDGRDLERLAFADQVRNRRRGEQDLPCRYTLTAHLLAERLRDHALEHLREHDADLRLPVRGELIDDAVHRRRRGGGVQGAEHQVPRLRRFERNGDGLEVAHFADQHDVRILTEGRPERRLEAFGVDVHLPLGDQALLVFVDELDRVFDRDDVIGALPIDEVDERAERGGLA